MASADWQKMTTQKAAAVKVHFRQKDREEKNHSNTDIDRSLSKRNYAIGCSDYDEAVQHMKKRTAEVDAVIPPKRIRKDRVTCAMIEIPCPGEIRKAERSDEFFQKAYETLAEFFGRENVHGGFVHKDEVHEYVGKDGQTQESLEHIHVLVSAYTEKKGINGKAFETRERLKKLNNELHDMCVREFAVDFNTHSAPDRKTVEDLKRESYRRELQNDLEREEEAARETRRDIQKEEKYKHWLTCENERAVKKKMLLSQDEYELRTRVEGLRAEAESAEKQNEELKAEAENIKKQNKQAKKRLSNMQNKLKYVETNIHEFDEHRSWQLPEPTGWMTVTGYREKIAEPFVEKLKRYIKDLTMKYVAVMSKVEDLTRELKNAKSRVEGLSNACIRLETENIELSRQAREYAAVRRAAGERLMQELYRKVTEQEQRDRAEQEERERERRLRRRGRDAR